MYESRKIQIDALKKIDINYDHCSPPLKCVGLAISCSNFSLARNLGRRRVLSSHERYFLYPHDITRYFRFWYVMHHMECLGHKGLNIAPPTPIPEFFAHFQMFAVCFFSLFAPSYLECWTCFQEKKVCFTYIPSPFSTLVAVLALPSFSACRLNFSRPSFLCCTEQIKLWEINWLNLATFLLNLLNRFCSEYLGFIAGQVRRIDVVEDVLKVMMNWLGCAEESVAGPDDSRRKSWDS